LSFEEWGSCSQPTHSSQKNQRRKGKQRRCNVEKGFEKDPNSMRSVLSDAYEGQGQPLRGGFGAFDFIAVPRRFRLSGSSSSPGRQLRSISSLVRFRLVRRPPATSMGSAGASGSRVALLRVRGRLVGAGTAKMLGLRMPGVGLPARGGGRGLRRLSGVRRPGLMSSSKFGGSAALREKPKGVARPGTGEALRSGIPVCR
jgi:hypothetical protein